MTRETVRERRENVARQIWADYDRRVARGRKLWATFSILSGVAGLMVGYTPGGFLAGMALIAVAGACARAAI